MDARNSPRNRHRIDFVDGLGAGGNGDRKDWVRGGSEGESSGRDN